MTSKIKSPTFFISILPILILIVLLVLNVNIYGEDATYGSNQIALIISTAVSVIIGLSIGFSWNEIQKGIVNRSIGWNLDDIWYRSHNDLLWFENY